MGVALTFASSLALYFINNGEAAAWLNSMGLNSRGLSQNSLTTHVQKIQERIQEGITSQFQTSEGTTPTTTVSQVSRFAMAQNAQPSENWAGYVVSPSGQTPDTSVTGSWKVPNITGNNNSAAAQWIGLGGVSSHDLLQVGTIEEFSGNQSVANVFWEQLPDTAKEVLSVPIGSTINAKIAKSTGSTWLITVNATTPAGKALSKTVPVTLSGSYATGIESSAEWVSEDPSNGKGNLYPLANMGTVNYSNATVDGLSMNSTANQVSPIAMVNQNTGNILVAPSTLEGTGASFSTSTLSTASSPATPFGRRRGERAWRRHGDELVVYGQWNPQYQWRR